MSCDPLHSGVDDKEQAVLALLDSRRLPYVRVAHAAVYTMRDSAALDIDLPGVRCKNLFLHDKKKRQFFLLTTTPDKTVDLKALAASLDCPRLSFASAETLAAKLGIGAGALSPLALVNDQDGTVQLLFDQDLEARPVLCFHPLVNTATLCLTRAAFSAFTDSIGHPRRSMHLTEDH